MKSIQIVTPVFLGMQSTPGKQLLPPLLFLRAVLLSALFLMPSACFAELKIERAQREFQARHFLITGKYVKWPACRCGGAASQTPNFPKDGFYGDVSLDPDLALTLVQDLAGKFHDQRVPANSESEIHLYHWFADHTGEGFENVNMIVNFGNDDFPTLETITRANYHVRFQEIEERILRLQYIQELSASRVALEAKEDNASAHAQTGATCSEVRACAITHAGEADWNVVRNYYWHSVHDTDLTQYVVTPCVLGTDRTRYVNYEYGEGLGVQYRIGEGNDMTSQYINIRGKIQANLSKYKSGTAKIYLKLTEWGSTFGQTRPTSADANKFGLWSAGTLPLGDPTATSGYVTGSETLPSPLECPGAELGGASSGWRVSDQIVIVKPELETPQDKVDCGGCGCEAASTSAKAGSVHVKIDIGSLYFGGSAGFFLFQEDKPTDMLSSRLRYSFDDSFLVNTLPSQASHNDLEQVFVYYTKELADVIRVPPSKFILRFYRNGYFSNTTGRYVSNEDFYKTVTLENPDGDTNIVVLTEWTANETKVSKFAYSTTANGYQWVMTTGGNTATEWMRKEVSATEINATGRLETRSVYNPDNSLVYRVAEQHHKFAWGEEMVTQVIDPDGAALTTTWAFGETAGLGYGQVASIIEAGGRWERYEYDTFGRKIKTVTQFISNGVGGSESANRKVVTTFLSGGPDYSTEEFLLGQLVSKVITRFGAAGESTQIRLYTLAAAEGDAQNLRTIQKNDVDGRPTSVKHEDGTMTISGYLVAPPSYTTLITTVDAGQPDGEAIVNGTRTVTIVNLAGRPVSTESYTIPGNILTDRQVYSQPDDFGRPQRIDYLDGTYSETHYHCCNGGISWQKDRAGTITEYFYDALARQRGVLQTSLDLATTNLLDAAGNVLSTTRVGRYSTLPALPITLQNSKFDGAGRLKAQWSVFNGVTLFTYPSPNERTSIYTNGATRVESSFQDGQLESISGSSTHPVSYAYGIDGASSEPFVLELRGASESMKTLTDFLGRSHKIVYPGTGNPATESIFNNGGQLKRQIDPDGVSIVSAYNGRGEPQDQALDLNRNGEIDFSGTDRINRTLRDVVLRPAAGADLAANVTVTSNLVWTTDNNGTATAPVSSLETSVEGLTNWSTVWKGTTPVTTKSVTLYPGAGERRATQTAPDGSSSVSVILHGRLLSVTRFDATPVQISRTTNGYDAHGRLTEVWDARNGTMFYEYNDADQVTLVTTPIPAAGQNSQVTQTYYDLMGQPLRTVYPDTTSVTNYYHLSGERAYTAGSRVYPVCYGYDYAGRLRYMTNWGQRAGSVAGTGIRVTAWNYSSDRGWLTSKTYPGGIPGPTYTYKPSGRLESRTWARGIVTTYGYNAAGQVETLSYAGGTVTTPAVSYAYDRRGRSETTVRDGMSTTFTYNEASQLSGESHVGGILDGQGVTVGFDTFLRRQSLSVNSQPSSLNQSYSYDTVSRLQNLAFSSDSATYSYLPNSPLLDSMVFRQAANVRMTTTRQHDKLNRLLSISSQPSGAGAPVSAGYGFNPANQRDRRTEADGSYWLFGYDLLGQVKSGKKYWSDNTSVAGQQFEYGHDDIGNRLSAKMGGDQTGNPAVLRSAAYTPDLLNRYVSRDVPNSFDVIGVANAPATVTVNGQSAYRKSTYYRKEVTVDNSAGAVYATETIGAYQSGVGAESSSGQVFVPPVLESFTHDSDGNLLADGRWNLTWDGENQLVKAESHTGGPSASKRKIEFEYDCRNRRSGRKVYVWNQSSGQYPAQPASYTKFVYDGWNMVAELDATDDTVAPKLLRSYVWGQDLSGSLQGAGGVGGLVAMRDHRVVTLPPALYFYAYDGNGNVAGLVSAATGEIKAQYEYGPFGELIRATGPLSQFNPFRFSTKYQDDVTDLLYYGYRCYNASTGRWLNRDPIAENGGYNLYGFVGNNPVNGIDLLGLALYAFDGTGNNDREIDEGKFTWIVTLREVYEGRRYYEAGVGSSFGTRAVGGLTGLGGRARLERAYREFLRNYNSGDKDIDIIGFSRGAAMAREFANMIYERGDGSGKRTITTQMGKHSISQTDWGKPCKIPDIRYVGLFDSVNMTIGNRLNLPPNVKAARQAVAADEQRYMFPLTPLGSGGDGQDFGEQPFSGDHSDIGRAHGPDTRDLSYAPLLYIWSGGIAVGVPFGPLPDFIFTGNTTPHDLSSEFPYNIFPKRPR